MSAARSSALHVRCGRTGVYALELKSAGARPALKPAGAALQEGELPAGWRSALVLTADDERGALRLYRLEPATNLATPAELAFHGLYVRGAFVAREEVGKPRDLNLAWAAWRGE